MPKPPPFRVQRHEADGWHDLPEGDFNENFHAAAKADALAEVSGQRHRVVSDRGVVTHCVGCEFPDSES